MGEAPPACQGALLACHIVVRYHMGYCGGPGEAATILWHLAVPRSMGVALDKFRPRRPASSFERRIEYLDATRAATVPIL